MGGAQPLAATFNGAACLGVEANPKQIQRRIDTGYCDEMTDDLDEALELVLDAAERFSAAPSRDKMEEMRKRLGMTMPAQHEWPRLGES